jgi:osmotically-inducible protein OsmY
MKPIPLLACLLLPVILSGCAAVLVGSAATAGAVHDRRSVGTVIDDQTLEVAAIDRIYQERDRFGGSRITAIAHNGVLLLAGEVADEALRQRAGERVQELAGVRRVINELAVAPPAGVARISADGALTLRIKAGLLDLDVPGFDASRVNVTTVRQEVYLMGLLRRAEADAVVNEVRRMRGVHRVIKAFEYLD